MAYLNIDVLYIGLYIDRRLSSSIYRDYRRVYIEIIVEYI
jgi:hypothetical protein